MRKIINSILVFITIFMFNSCAGLITLKTPKITGGKIETEKKYIPKKPPVLFEDFEAGTVIGAYSYANTAGGASAKYVISEPGKDEPHSGKYCAKAIYDSGTNSDWGCGFGAQSAYGGGFIDAKDREYISLWIKAKPGLNFYVFCNEASANGADGEYWNSPNLLGTGKWELYEIPMEQFYKNVYSGNQQGNNVIDMTGIGTVGAQIGGAQGAGELFIDDIYFK